MTRYDMAVLIGRFQPFHNGHLAVIEKALERADKVLILVGSANLARDTRNPFTYEERRGMIRDALDGAAFFRDGFDTTAGQRITIAPLPDSPYDLQEWIEQVQTLVKLHAAPMLRPRVCLTGNDRDATSYYLKLFPQWTYEPTGALAGDIASTGLREAYFAGGVNFHDNAWKDSGPVWPQVVPPETIAFLDKFRGTSFYGRLMDDRKAEIDYRAEWGHKEPHTTVDAVVIQSGHVLVIRRGGRYGTGMLAIPGGHLEPHETLLDGAVRECFEETMLFSHLVRDNYITDERRRMLHTHMRGRDVFGDPNRSRRGRVITHAFLFKLPDDYRLPEVKANDDAAEAFWLPISEVKADEFFEDHAFVIERLIRTCL
ncbi:bifunctional NMN adenylyltransferase/nudix hydrolase [Bajunvirus bajun]|uniref:Bifunctional NMN adenylyltransferase/nudix hydrolase n=1 Tax=Brevundimonas phage vB_BgoS-Bajun TaxID=2948594 RepID=A0A9E7N4J0_9CAUD|nr:bifunctional NMN adenylyltransferase/nudix hydrolase [Brevundimonas phage vB_BgoS-Bajun]